MHLGIKIGPGDWLAKLENNLHIEHVEVYFDLARLDDYAPLFERLRDDGAQAGLHTSTTLDGGVMLNLATANDEVRRASASMLRRIIDVAAEQGMRFVIVHPGAYRIWGILGGRTFTSGVPTPPAEGRRRVVGEAVRLAAYAQARGVAFLAENMPGYDYVSYDPVDREQVVDVSFVPSSVLRELGERGVGLCVDIGHLYAEVAARAPGKDGFPQVMDITRQLVPYAHHLHVSTTILPWNGTDSHNGFLPEDYAQVAVPSRTQLLAWLHLFDGRDVWVIPEPWGSAGVHLANYRLLKAWMEQLD